MEGTDTVNDQPIFIVGMQRSGTGLMRSLLNAHPAIALSPGESHFVLMVHGWSDLNLSRAEDPEVLWNRLVATSFFARLSIDVEAARRHVVGPQTPEYKTIIAGMLRDYAKKQNRHRWGDKTPQHARYIDVLLDWYPGARIVYMIRDPRSVIASLLTVDFRNHRIRPLVDGFAARWRENSRTATHWSRDERVTLVGYEGLVSDTETELRRICDFVGEPYVPTMLDRSSAEPRPPTPRDGEPTQLVPLRDGPVTAARIERWREVLSPSQVATIEHLARREMLEHGYHPSTQRLPHLLRPQLMVVRGARICVRSARGLRRPAQLRRR